MALVRLLRVALFITCLNHTLFPQTGRAVLTLLERLGCEVDFPEAQTYCGQMHTNTGYRGRGLTLARRFERSNGSMSPGRSPAIAAPYARRDRDERGSSYELARGCLGSRR